jgi:aspartate-semialdehyde dehydrogenase
MSARKNNHKKCYKVAIVQSSTLKGKELKQVLEERCFPISSLKLLDVEEYKGKLTQFGDEAKIVLGIDEDSFEKVDIAFFCGSPDNTQKYLPWAQRHKVICIDLSQAMVKNEDIPHIVSGINDKDIRGYNGVVVNPHPVAIIISTFLHALNHASPVEKVICTVFQPASELGEEGINELFNQSVSLLNFHEIPIDIFKKQLAFNLLPASILSNKNDIDEIEDIIVKQINKILKYSISPFTLRLVQAPVFHSYSLFAFAQLKEELPVSDIQKNLSLKSGLIFPASKSRKALWPSPAEVAGNDDIYLGQIKKDNNIKAGYWFWIVADNLRRGCVLNAVSIAEMITSQNFQSVRRST